MNAIVNIGEQDTKSPHIYGFWLVLKKSYNFKCMFFEIRSIGLNQALDDLFKIISSNYHIGGNSLFIKRVKVLSRLQIKKVTTLQYSNFNINFPNFANKINKDNKIKTF